MSAMASALSGTGSWKGPFMYWGMTILGTEGWRLTAPLTPEVWRLTTPLTLMLLPLSEALELSRRM
jgi:hypothetical protein